MAQIFETILIKIFQNFDQIGEIGIRMDGLFLENYLYGSTFKWSVTRPNQNQAQLSTPSLAIIPVCYRLNGSPTRIWAVLFDEIVMIK